MSFYINNYRGFTDFNIIQYGYRKCEPGFAPARHARKTYLIHYVYRGEGTLEADGVIFHVKQGQAFLIFPDQVTTYTASQTNPFVYRWVEFYGDKASELIQKADLSPASPIFTDSGKMEAGIALQKLVDEGVSSPYSVLSKFTAFADALCKSDPAICRSDSEYVDKAINYIIYCANAKLTVNNVASYLNISRSFLSTIFSKKVGVPLKKYILDFNMSTAVSMLKNSSLSIHDIADSIGYNSTEEFSKAFKRYFGKSPSAYRSERL